MEKCQRCIYKKFALNTEQTGKSGNVLAVCEQTCRAARVQLIALASPQLVNKGSSSRLNRLSSQRLIRYDRQVTGISQGKVTGVSLVRYCKSRNQWCCGGLRHPRPCRLLPLSQV